MNRTLLIFGVQLAAFWPVWRWYVLRVVDSADQTWGLLALATALLIVLQKKATKKSFEHSLTLPTLLVLLYVVTYPAFPPLARAGVAFTALGVTLSLLRFGRPLHPGVLGLLWLSLPVIPSFQFYGGYPLRVLLRLRPALLRGNPHRIGTKESPEAKATTDPTHQDGAASQNEASLA